MWKERRTDIVRVGSEVRTTQQMLGWLQKGGEGPWCRNEIVGSSSVLGRGLCVVEDQV